MQLMNTKNRHRHNCKHASQQAHVTLRPVHDGRVTEHRKVTLKPILSVPQAFLSQKEKVKSSTVCKLPLSSDPVFPPVPALAVDPQEVTKYSSRDDKSRASSLQCKGHGV